MRDLTPQHIVRELDRYIVGQDEAKRTVAIALRNRYRRLALPVEIQAEITPKNILMIGPTGVGKTEIARRLAKLADAPFIKVEATKFTQVGYVGRDVDSIVRDLMDTAIGMVHDERVSEVREQATKKAEERILDILTEHVVAEEQPAARAPKVPSASQKPAAAVMAPLAAVSAKGNGAKAATTAVARKRRQQARKHVAERLARNELDEQIIEIELEPDAGYTSLFEFVAGTGRGRVGGRLPGVPRPDAPGPPRRPRISLGGGRGPGPPGEAQKTNELQPSGP